MKTQILPASQVDALVREYADGAYMGLTALVRKIEGEILSALSQEARPVAWMWQHQETGRRGFVEDFADEGEKKLWQQLNKPLSLVSPLYAHPQPAQQQDARDGERLDWLVNEGCVIECSQDGKRNWLYWPLYDEYQKDEFPTARAAVDAAIAAGKEKQ